MTDPVLVQFGRRVHAERTAQGLTLRELAAKRPGLTHSMIRRAEHAYSDLGLTSAVRIAAALGMPLGDLLGEEP